MSIVGLGWCDRSFPSVCCLMLLARTAFAGPVDLETWVNDFGGTVGRGDDGGIEAIDLSRSWISDIDLGRLAGIDTLQRLSLAQTHITDAALEVVESLPALRELDLFFCEHITDSGASMLREASGLERLIVRGTKISDSGVKFLTELVHLRSLDIGITEVSDATIDLLEAVPALESLAVGGNRVGEVGISSLRSLKRLRYLDLSGAQETDSGIWVANVTDLNLDQVGDLGGLESLNLAAPSRHYVDAVSSGVPRIRGAIRVTDFGTLQLARLTSLRRLNLTGSMLTAAGIRHLRSLDSLEHLNLAHGERIGNAAGAALAELHSLRSVNVSYTQFGDEGLFALRDHPNLLRIIAVGARITDEGVSEFVSAHPGGDVVY